MTRKKVKIAYIENATSRKFSSTKRTKGLIKKTQEINALCDVDACAIVYGKNTEVPMVWPKSNDEVRRIISNYKNIPEMYQSQRQLYQQSWSKQKLIKTEDKLARIQWKNRELEMENMIADIMTKKSTLEQVAPCDLDGLILVLENGTKSIEHRMKHFDYGKSSNNPNSPSPYSNCGDKHDTIPNQFHGDGMKASTSTNNYTSE